jgi:hypothetical protein
MFPSSLDVVTQHSKTTDLMQATNSHARQYYEKGCVLEGVAEHIRVEDQQSDVGKHGHDGDEHHHPSSEKHSTSDYHHGIADEYRTRGIGRTRHHRYHDSEKNGISTKPKRCNNRLKLLPARKQTAQNAYCNPSERDGTHLDVVA